MFEVSWMELFSVFYYSLYLFLIWYSLCYWFQVLVLPVRLFSICSSCGFLCQIVFSLFHNVLLLFNCFFSSFSITNQVFLHEIFSSALCWFSISFYLIFYEKRLLILPLHGCLMPLFIFISLKNGSILFLWTWFESCNLSSSEPLLFCSSTYNWYGLVSTETVYWATYVSDSVTI